MKKIFSILTSVAMLFSFTGCSDDDDDDDNATASSTFTIETTSFSFSAEGGTQYVNITASATPSLSSSQDWLTVAQSSAASGSYTFSLTADANTSDARTATVTASVGSASKTISVSQSAGTSQYAVDISTTAKEIAKAMVPGWNLGNTMESTGGETSWQNTQTTQEIIDYVKSLGFNSIRIPCAWYIYADADNSYKIDATWMARVTEVVDYCMNAGLYVELNDHWDNGWLEDNGFSASGLTTTTMNYYCNILTKLWTQIANNFKDYDGRLIFGGLNEPNKDQSDSFSDEQMSALQTYEQTFIDAVRATGGNNAQRVLVVQGPKTSLDETVEQFPSYMPTDNVADKLMVEVHYYEPYQFCQMETDASWGNVILYWGEENFLTGSKRNCNSYANESYQANQFASLKSTFYDNGYPVLIGEFGANWKNVTGWDENDGITPNQDLHDASIKSWFKAVVENSKANGCVPMVWDINGSSKPTMTIVSRSSLSVFNQYALDGIMEGAASATWPD